MRSRIMSVGLVAVVVFLAGCGSSSNTSSSGTTPASTSSSSAATSSSGTSSSSGTPFANAGNCQQLAGLGQKYALAIEAAVRGKKFDLQTEVTAYQNLANAAPAAIRPDLQVIAQAFNSFAAAITKSGFTIGSIPKPSQLPALQSSVQVFSDPKFRAAGQHISAWARQNCG